MVDINTPLPDEFSSGTPSDESNLIFDFPSARPVVHTQGGLFKTANLGTWPAVKGKGFSLVYVVAQPCSVGVPHYHPYADEVDYVVKGSNVSVGMKQPGGPLIKIKDVRAGQSVIFPKGWIHYFINLSCTETAEAMQVISGDEETFAQSVGSSLMDLPSEIVHAGLNTDQDIIEDLKS